MRCLPADKVAYLKGVFQLFGPAPFDSLVFSSRSIAAFIESMRRQADLVDLVQPEMRTVLGM